MRKIENKNDWDRFVKDCGANCSDDVLTFTVSQNGVDIGGFSARSIYLVFCPFLCFEDNDDKNKWFYSDSFYNELTGKYKAPFNLYGVENSLKWL